MPEMPGLHWGNLATTPIVGAPVAGTNAIQTTSITGGPPTTLTFRFRKDGVPTAPITWSNNNTTLLAAINAALDAAYGTASLVASAGTLTAGIGTILLTAGAKLARQVLSTVSIEKVSETGTATTLTNTTTTAGVNATLRDAGPSTMIHSTNGKVYINESSTPNTPNWVSITT